MSQLRDKAVQIVTDFFEVSGPFSGHRPEGMSGSTYPRALARFVEGSDKELQNEVVTVLVTFAMDGDHVFSQASGYVCLELALRGLATSFIPHVPKIKNWFETRAKMGWWTTDESYDAAPTESKNAIGLMNVLWCCDMGTANGLTEMLLRQSSSPKFRASLIRSKLLPHILES